MKNKLQRHLEAKLKDPRIVIILDSSPGSSPGLKALRMTTQKSSTLFHLISYIFPMLQIPNYPEIISQELNLKQSQINVVLDLTAEGATVPFIARYRKERTGSLDENQIRDIIEFHTKQENLYKAKQTAINGIEEMGKMTPELLENIINAKTLKEVEEIYKPYKSKKKTKAMIAIEKGFQVVADAIKMNNLVIPEELLTQYPKDEIIEGAQEIIGAEVSANSSLRHTLIELLNRSGQIRSSKKSVKMLEKLNQKDRDQIIKFEIYADFSLAISRIKPYQILALNRGENLGILTVKIEKDEMIFEMMKTEYRKFLENDFVSDRTTLGQNRDLPDRQSFRAASSAGGRDNGSGGRMGVFIPELLAGFEIGYEALFSSVENEIRGELSERGEDDSIATFQQNLGELLMTRPEYGKRILAVDPGYRVGCKLVVLDEFGNPLEFDKIYLHEADNAREKLKNLIKKYSLEVVAIGNGTACDETSALISEVIDSHTELVSASKKGGDPASSAGGREIEIFLVNESGASVYSASPIAQEEFPDLDSLDRGTVSIGRRYIDPLSELVKVPVGSIGVGMYQHDMPEKKLTEKLGYVVEDVVNQVGINVNNTSVHVLQHISGIDKRQAKKIYENRPYASRKELKKVLSAKAYELAIGFLRVPESKEPLDNTDIHPDQYLLARFVLEKNLTEKDFESHKSEISTLYPEANRDTISFILQSHAASGVEKRVKSTHQKAKKKLALEDIKAGDIFEGVVRNVVAFGAFVDIGLKSDGLVHISQLADRYISHPMDVVKVGDRVKVKIMNIDKTSGKISLSMKGL